MPLKTRTIVEMREEVVVQVEQGYSISEVARLHGLSRPTVYDWVDRYRSEGREGLKDRSRAPLSCPHRTPGWMERRLVEERNRWGFGSKKILDRLREEEPTTAWPSRAAVDALYKREGLVKPRRHREKNRVTPFLRRYEADEPGELSTIDYKGQFRLKNGRYCYALTMMDYVSRYLLACQALYSKHLEPTWQVIEQCLRRWGLPVAMQSDNGEPFGASGFGRITTISTRLMKLGIQPVFSRPGKPQDNAAHERMHRTLKERATIPPGRDLMEQQIKFDEFRHEFNHERPHEGIGMKRPARIYRGSPRPFPRRLPTIEYDSWFEVRYVGCRGSFTWHSKEIFISQALAGERIGLVPSAYDMWDLYFGSFSLGKFNERTGRVF